MSKPWVLLLHEVEREEAAVGLDDAVPLALEDALDQSADLVLVVHDEDQLGGGVRGHGGRLGQARDAGQLLADVAAELARLFELASLELLVDDGGGGVRGHARGGGPLGGHRRHLGGLHHRRRPIARRRGRRRQRGIGLGLDAQVLERGLGDVRAEVVVLARVLAIVGGGDRVLERLREGDVREDAAAGDELELVDHAAVGRVHHREEQLVVADEHREDALGLGDLAGHEIEIHGGDRHLRQIDAGHAVLLRQRLERLGLRHDAVLDERRREGSPVELLRLERLVERLGRDGLASEEDLPERRFRSLFGHEEGALMTPAPRRSYRGSRPASPFVDAMRARVSRL